jgi:hypothetical protein
MPEAAALRNDGLRRAGEGLDDWWRRTALQAIKHLVAVGRPFTADDVRDLGVPDPPSPKAAGALFGGLSRSGLIEPVGYVKSRHPTAHAATVRVWLGARRGEAS